MGSLRYNDLDQYVTYNTTHTPAQLLYLNLIYRYNFIYCKTINRLSSKGDPKGIWDMGLFRSSRNRYMGYGVI